MSTQANITEKTSCGTSANSALNEIYSTKEQNSSIVQKQEKMESKKEIAVFPLKEVIIFFYIFPVCASAWHSFSTFHCNFLFTPC